MEMFKSSQLAELLNIDAQVHVKRNQAAEGGNSECSIVLYGMVWYMYGMTWYGMVWYMYGMVHVWYGRVWYGMVWYMYGMV